MTTMRTTRRPVRLMAVSMMLGASVLLGSSAPAAAAANNPGTVRAGWGSCRDNQIHVTVPLIMPAPVQYGSTPLFGNPSQQVAWRANLDQLIGGRWVKIREGIWLTGTANTSSDYGLGQTTWRTLAGAPMPWPLGFGNLASGTFQAPIYYRVWFDFYWYADAYRGAGSGWAWADGHQENRANAQGAAVIDQTAYGYCKYRGPNWRVG